MKKCLLVLMGAFHADGGIPSVNRLMIQAIAEDGYALDIFCLIEDDRTINTAYLLETTSVRYSVFHRDKYAFTLSVWRALLTETYDYVLVDHINLASMLAPLSKLKRCSYIVWLHGTELFQPRPDFEGRMGLKYAWKRLANSDFTRQCVLKRFPDLSVALCELALDPVRYGSSTSVEPYRAGSTIELEAVNQQRNVLGGQVILHVGRMAFSDSYKGHAVLLQTFSTVQACFPDAQLVLAGQGDDRERLLAQARSLPSSLQSRIFLPGFVPTEELDQIYRTCYVFAMPSFGEGFGLVYLEAMSRGKPCLGGRVDATSCVVRDGLTGLLVDDPRSPEQVAAALNWFLAHPKESQEMGRKGFELVNSHYLFPHFKQRFWQLLLSDRP